jgi:hypothetical protein
MVLFAGSEAPDELVELADTVTEIRRVNHVIAWRSSRHTQPMPEFHGVDVLGFRSVP